MNWRFPGSFLGSGPVQNQASDVTTQSWYPPGVTDSSSSSSRPSTPGNSPGTATHQRASEHFQSQSSGHPSPSEAARIIEKLKDKSVDDLRKLLTDKDAYDSFFASLDQVRDQNNLREELLKETLQCARENLDKEPRILELRNQCQIIRTTELAAAQERLAELEKQKEEILKSFSPHLLLQKLQDAIDKIDEESEILHQQLLENEIDLSSFVQRYKKLRMIHHRRSLIHLAAKTNILGSA
ncbi:vacuolar protein-sorting-associated protein 37 homolog 1-like isoform X2 [Wolffia australiana]